MTRKRNIAIILAGGTGTRLGGNIPKQFLDVKGKMIIEYTIEAFESHDSIDEVAVICHADYIQMITESVNKRQYTKVGKILNGGKNRFYSSLTAIHAYDDGEQKNILFHDAVRPLVTSKIITDCILKLDSFNAVGTGIETTDTIWTVRDGNIDSIPDRRNIYRAQTPQAFDFKTIHKAYETAFKGEEIPITDDCGVVIHTLPDEKIGIVDGNNSNIKITRVEDLVIFENLLNKKQD